MEDTDEVLEKIKAIMAEHSMNYAFSIIDEEGDLRYDYSNCLLSPSPSPLD